MIPTIKGNAKSRILVTPQIYRAPTITKVVREVNKLLDNVCVILRFTTSCRSSFFVMTAMFSRTRSKITMVALME